jgi:hypothetical protein
LASIIFCAIIATGYLQDLDFQGWARAGQNDEIVDGCLSLLSSDPGLPVTRDLQASGL